MTILAIDPGTNTGWAVMSPDGAVVACGTWKLKLKDTEPYGARFGRFDSFFVAAITQYLPTEIVYEKVRNHKGAEAGHVYGAIEAAIAKLGLQWEIPVVPIEVGAIKQCATGRGNAKKPEMIAAACRKWPQVTIVDDNMPDALWCAETRRTGFQSTTKKKARKAAKAAKG